MGKWLAEALALDENFSKTAQSATDETDKTLNRGIPSVLSVPHSGDFEKLAGEDGNPEARFVSFVSAGSSASVEKIPPDGRALVRVALADFERRLADIPRRNEDARHRGSTDRWCEHCGDFASNAWPDERGRERWLCLACHPVEGNA